MIRKKKLYVRPKKMYEKVRIEEENNLKKKYALKSKREVWKVDAKVDYYRSRAKDLAKASMEEQKILFGKLTSLGIKVDSIADVLALKIENFLERRLPYILFRKGLAKTPQQARQFVAHKNVLINNNVVNSPSYIVPVAEENSISLRVKAKVKKPKAEVAAEPIAVPAEVAK